MAATNLTKCVICGEAYPYCPSCSRTHAWKFYTDTHEHYQIYMIIDDFNKKAIDTKKAKEMFENIGITSETNLDNLKPVIKEQIKKIVGYAEPKSNKHKSE